MAPSEINALIVWAFFRDGLPLNSELMLHLGEQGCAAAGLSKSELSEVFDTSATTRKFDCILGVAGLQDCPRWCSGSSNMRAYGLLARHAMPLLCPPRLLNFNFSSNAPPIPYSGCWMSMTRMPNRLFLPRRPMTTSKEQMNRRSTQLWISPLCPRPSSGIGWCSTRPRNHHQPRPSR